MNSKVGHDMWLKTRRGAGRQLGRLVHRSGAEGRRKTCLARGGSGVAQIWPDRSRESPRAQPARRLRSSYPPNTSSLRPSFVRSKATKPDIVYGLSSRIRPLLRAVNEIGIGDDVKVFGGGMVGIAVRRRDGESGVVAHRRRQLQHLAAGTEHVSRRHQVVFRGLSKRAVEAKVDRSAIIWAPYGYATGQMIEAAVNATQVARPEGLAKYLRENEHKTSSGRSRFEPMRVEGRQRAGAVPGVWSTRTSSTFRSLQQVILYPDK